MTNLITLEVILRHNMDWALWSFGGGGKGEGEWGGVLLFALFVFVGDMGLFTVTSLWSNVCVVCLFLGGGVGVVFM